MTEIPCQTVRRKRRGERDCEEQENESLHSLLHGHRDHVSPCPSVPHPHSLLPMHRELQDDKKPPIKTADLLTARDTRLNLQPFSRRRIDPLSEQRGGTLGDYSNLHANTCSTYVQMFCALAYRATMAVGV